MKERNGFVSNSSSSSFIINKEYLSSKVKDLLLDSEKLHKAVEAFKSDFEAEDVEDWSISEDSNGDLYCSCVIDNFNLIDFVTDKLHIDRKAISNVG